MKLDARTIGIGVVNAWNSHDLENILSHYRDDFELNSPIIKKVLNIESGTLIGKEAVRGWWRQCLNKIPDLTFEFIDVAESTDGSIALIQRSSHNNKHVVSIFYIDENNKIYKEIYYN